AWIRRETLGPTGRGTGATRVGAGRRGPRRGVRTRRSYPGIAIRAPGRGNSRGGPGRPAGPRRRCGAGPRAAGGVVPGWGRPASPRGGGGGGRGWGGWVLGAGILVSRAAASRVCAA